MPAAKGGSVDTRGQRQVLEGLSDAVPENPADVDVVEGVSVRPEPITVEGYEVYRRGPADRRVEEDSETPLLTVRAEEGDTLLDRIVVAVLVDPVRVEGGQPHRRSAPTSIGVCAGAAASSFSTRIRSSSATLSGAR